MKVVSRVVRVLVALGLAATAFLVVFSRMAKGSQRDRIRQFNRDVLNPWMLGRAGGERWYASVVKHVGRVSGNEYETPVVMYPTADGFVIPLPYGTDVDWVENLRRMGRGAVLHRGVEHTVRGPVVVSRSSIADQLGWRDALRYRGLGIDDFLRLQLDPDVPLAV